jgi:hypothetical protein
MYPEDEIINIQHREIRCRCAIGYRRPSMVLVSTPVPVAVPGKLMMSASDHPLHAQTGTVGNRAQVEF